MCVKGPYLLFGIDHIKEIKRRLKYFSNKEGNKVEKLPNLLKIVHHYMGKFLKYFFLVLKIQCYFLFRRLFKLSV